MYMYIFLYKDLVLFEKGFFKKNNYLVLNFIT